MSLIAPKPVFLAENKIALGRSPRPIWKRTPIGSDFRLKYILAYYPITIIDEDGLRQLEHDLRFELRASDGWVGQIAPVLIKQVTSPASLLGLRATQPINKDFPAGSDIGVFIHGWRVDLPIPWISITLFGIQAESSFGGNF